MQFQNIIIIDILNTQSSGSRGLNKVILCDWAIVPLLGEPDLHLRDEGCPLSGTYHHERW